MSQPRPNRRTGAICFALPLALLCALVPGCAAPPPTSINNATGPDPQRVARAYDLADAAQQAEEKGRYDQAISTYQEAVRAYREFPAAWNNLGVLLMDQGRYLEAGECFSVAADLTPLDPRPAYNFGLTWDLAGYPEDALIHYNRALQRDPRFLPALRGAIKTERHLGRGDERTLERLRTALTLEQDPKWREWMELQRLRIENADRAAAVGLPETPPPDAIPTGN